MQYWHNLITQKSFQALKELKRDYRFILIGGWAVFLYTRALKSKDIDIVADYETLSQMKEKFEVTKNTRLKKYEIKEQGFDIDVYLPYFSNPGLPAEEIMKFTAHKEGFQIPIPEVLLILKQVVFQQRKDTPKGNKDKIDIFALLASPGFDWSNYKKILRDYDLLALTKQLEALLKETFEIEELGLTRHKMARLKKEILRKIQ